MDQAIPASNWAFMILVLSLATRMITSTIQSGNSSVMRNNLACSSDINSRVWEELHIDQFVKNYPDAAKIPLTDFAAKGGAMNFVCGIGQSCQAGQLCAPVQAPVWQVLYSAQKWNSYMNMFYEVIGDVASSVSDIAASLVADLYIGKKEHSKFFKLAKILDFMTGIVIASTMTALFVPEGQIAVALATSSALSDVTNRIIERVQAKGESTNSEDAFSEWAGFAYQISQWQTSSQAEVQGRTTILVEKGLTSPGGLAEVFRGGHFFNKRPLLISNGTKDSMRKSITIRLLSEIMTAKKGYITIGSDECKQGGPNGAFRLERGWLSYCNPKGVMMNIIYAEENHARNDWHNANLISEKYGLTVEYLANQAWNCQKKYGFSHDPYRKGNFPNDEKAECLFNLPVCDCRQPDIARGRKDGKGTTVVCREVGKLPI